MSSAVIRSPWSNRSRPAAADGIATVLDAARTSPNVPDEVPGGRSGRRWRTGRAAAGTGCLRVGGGRGVGRQAEDGQPLVGLGGLTQPSGFTHVHVVPDERRGAAGPVVGGDQQVTTSRREKPLRPSSRRSGPGDGSGPNPGYERSRHRKPRGDRSWLDSTLSPSRWGRRPAGASSRRCVPGARGRIRRRSTALPWSEAAPEAA
jgi:hypothetical protein